MISKLYVGNIAFTTTKTDLRYAFGQFGTITAIEIASDLATGRPRGFAFVTFGTAEEGEIAMVNMHGFELAGFQLTVNEADLEGSASRNRRNRARVGMPNEFQAGIDGPN